MAACIAATVLLGRSGLMASDFQPQASDTCLVSAQALMLEGLFGEPWDIPHSTQFSGNAPMPAPSPCNWVGIPPCWVISNTTI
jgi:hypothetical protein